MGYREEMAEHTEGWEEAEVMAGREKLAAGVYADASITTSRMQKSDRTNEWQLFLVYTDNETGGEVPMWYDIEQKIGASIAKGILSTLGWDKVDDPAGVLELEDLCESGFFQRFSLSITVKDKPGETVTFKQVFINSVRDAGSTPTEDDIPF